MQDRVIILLSCSRDKRQGGRFFDSTARRFGSSNCLPHNGNSILRHRRKIAEMLRGRQGRLYNQDQAAGFRDLRGVNRALYLGPDLDGLDNHKEIYLPAYERYSGRFFTKLASEAPDFWSRLERHPVEVLLVSGLYGLLFWDEMIQEYDCHLGDYIDGKDPKQTVASAWKRCLTDALCEFVKTERDSGRPIRHIYDLLSEGIYQDAFDWERIGGIAGVHVHHRVFRPISGTDTLPYIAEVLSGRLADFYNGSDAFRDGHWNTCGRTSGRAVEFKFEFPLQGDLDKSVNDILDEFPGLRCLPGGIFDKLSVAETSWQMAQVLTGIDYGIFVVAYAKCFEEWADSMMPGWGEQIEGQTSNRGIQPRRQNPTSVFKTNRKLAFLENAARTFWEIRGLGAHSGKGLTRTKVNKARQLVLKVMSEGAQALANGSDC